MSILRSKVSIYSIQGIPNEKILGTSPTSSLTSTIGFTNFNLQFRTILRRIIMNTKHTEKIEQFKNDIKLVTVYTKQFKKLFKESQRTKDDSALEKYKNGWKESKKIPHIIDRWYPKYYTRHLHVAYALLKGNTLEEIEGNTRKELNHELVKKYIVQYTGSEELANSIDLADPKAKLGGMFQSVMNLIKGGE